eukprot:COSAG06_NODE_22744_length_713_cov_0.866667_1_plen_110_part_01
MAAAGGGADGDEAGLHENFLNAVGSGDQVPATSSSALALESENSAAPLPMWPPWEVKGWEQIRRCVALSICYFFMFTAWNSAQTLASTLPIPPPASGNTAMSIVYGTFTI